MENRVRRTIYSGSRTGHNTSFKIDMVTVGRWKSGKMIERSFFWDNLEFMKKIGVAK